MTWKRKQNFNHPSRSTISTIWIRIRVISIVAVRTGRLRRVIRQSVQMIKIFPHRRFGCLKGQRWIWAKARWRSSRIHIIVCIGWSTRTAKYKESISRWRIDIKNMLEANKTNRLSISRVWTPRQPTWMATRCWTSRIWLEQWSRMDSKTNHIWPRDIRDRQVNHASSTFRSWHLWRTLRICNKMPR